MSKPKHLTTAAAETERRLSYFIDVIGRSGFQGGYQWAFRQLDGSWKIWRSGIGEASAPTMTPTRSSIGSRSNCKVQPSAEMAVAVTALDDCRPELRGALMMSRKRLPDRRHSEILELELHGLRYTASFSRFADGGVAEIFLQNHKPGSQSDANARDAAVAASLALQFGCPLETLQHAVLRDSTGRPSTPLGAAIDAITGRGDGK